MEKRVEEAEDSLMYYVPGMQAGRNGINEECPDIIGTFFIMIVSGFITYLLILISVIFIGMPFLS